jgi:ankyrin repeat protein
MWLISLGETPLDIACIKNDLSTVAALLEAGASLEATGLLHNIIRGTKENIQTSSTEKRASKKKSAQPKRDNSSSSSHVSPAEVVDEENLFELLQKYNYPFSYVDAEGNFRNMFS